MFVGFVTNIRYVPSKWSPNVNFQQMLSKCSLNVNRFLPSTAKPRQGKSSPLLSVALSCLQGWRGQIFLAPNLMFRSLPQIEEKRTKKRNNVFFFLPTFASRLLTLGDSFNQLWNCFTNQKTLEILSIKSFHFLSDWSLFFGPKQQSTTRKVNIWRNCGVNAGCWKADAKLDCWL